MKNHRRHRHGLELLEARRLLSAGDFTGADLLGVAEPHFHATFDAGHGITGYSPAQVKKAYGFDQISFGNVPGNGAGQTIAIVDAFHDPNIQSDLNVFDAQFNLPNPPSFQQVSQTGGSPDALLQDSGWASEAALDVEWAHAIAPGANIVLVETNSDSYRDLMRGVDLARHLGGVSVVSTSWGGSEFRGQTAYDTAFTTPSGHGGVTFVASSGDDGTLDGAEWPATSPNVVSVGGTVLKIADSSGAYGSEIAWNYSTGGSSAIERAPAFEKAAQGGKMRQSPDVAYNSSVIHGFAVYSSVPDGGDVGWANVGGTSAGTPQWAALIAIADQGRALQGKPALDGATGTLPTLYSLYSSPGSANYSAYTSNFHDISTGYVVQSSSAHSGYDNATGLGSPKAQFVVSALVNKTAAATAKAASGRTRSARPHLVRGHHAVKIGGTDGEITGEITDSVTTETTPITTASLPPVTYPVLLPVSPAAAPTITTVDTTTSSAGFTPRAVASAMRSGFAYTDSADQSSDAALQARPVVDLAVASFAPTAIVEVSAADAPVEAQLPAPKLQATFDFSHPEAATAFADSLSSFVHDSTTLATTMLPTNGNLRAWTITAAVVTVDAILVGSWYASYRRAKQKVRVRELSSPFATNRVEW